MGLGGRSGNSFSYSAFLINAVLGEPPVSVEPIAANHAHYKDAPGIEIISSTPPKHEKSRDEHEDDQDGID